jgi:hypothetical protein
LGRRRAAHFIFGRHLRAKWTDITPRLDKPGELSNAWYFANGDIYVAGGGQKAYIRTMQ